MGTGVSRTCGSLFGIEDTSSIPSSDNYLKYLYVTSGATFVSVSPAFQSGYGSYTVSIPYGYKYVLLTPIAADVTASVRVDLKVDPAQIDVATLATDSTLGASVITPQAVRDDLAEQRVQEEDERELAQLRVQVDSGVDGAKDLLKRRMSQRKLLQAQIQAASANTPLANDLPKPRSFNIQPLQVGDNQLGVIVTAQNGTTRVYSVKVHRDDWEPNGWQPGSDIDKYRWYYQNATEGNAVAQFRLASMFSGEDGIVLVPQGQEGSYELQDPEKFRHVPPAKLVAMQDDVCKYQAFKYLLAAAQQKHLSAVLKLADLCYHQQIPQRITEELEQAIDSKNTGELSPSAPEYWKREAAQWLLAAATLNHVPSAARLVDLYINGVGVPCDYKQATQWLCKTGPTVEKASVEVMARLRAAMADGSSKAAEQLSLMYVEAPVGVPMDYVQALDCLKHTGEDSGVISTRVADQFVTMSKRPNPVGAEAAVQLAMMHRDGVGLPVDYKKVLMWLDRAGQSKDVAYQTVVKWFSELAEREAPSACEQLGWMYADGVGVHTDYKNAVHWLVRSGMEKEASEKQVAERLSAAANQGNPRSAYQLALMYVDGAGVDTDYKKALQWLDKAGQQVSQAHKQAAEWFEKQANTGDKRAAYQMALMYIDGVGVTMSFVEALKWLEKAGQSADFAQQLVSSRLLASAEKRNVESSAQLAKMFMDYQNSMQWLVAEGKPEEYFHSNAATWFRVAGEEGDLASSITMAQMYLDGVGLPIDFKLASYWWEKAGKSKEYSKKKIDNKLQSLKPKYRMLFDFYAQDQGRINIVNFASYYRDCLMAKGLSKRRADEETVSTYLGRSKYEALFKSYDVNHDSTLEFEEIWSHPHTHTNLFPKTGQHVMAAEAFFRKWSPEAAAELLAKDDLLPPTLSRPQSSRSLSMSGALSARNLHRDGSKRASLDRARTEGPSSSRSRARSASGSTRHLSARDLDDFDDARSDTSRASRSTRDTRSEYG